MTLIYFVTLLNIVIVTICVEPDTMFVFEGTIFLNSSQPVIKTNISDNYVIENITDILRSYARRMEKASKTLGNFLILYVDDMYTDIAIERLVNGQY